MNKQKRKIQLQNRILPFCLFLLGAVLPLGAQAPDKLYMYAPNGSEQSFALNRLKMTFGSQQLYLHPWGGSPLELSYSKVASITFARRGETGIAPVADGGEISIRFNPAAGDVTVESNAAIETVRLFNLQGVLLHNLTPRSTSASFSLSTFPAGVYIVQAVGNSIKSVKKIIKQ
jgi:hypothetical protein